MQIGNPVDDRLPWVRTISDLRDARSIQSAGRQLKELRRVGERLGDALRSGPRVVAVRTLPLTTLIYPTTFAFNRAVPLPVPYVVMTHRCLLVQVLAEGELKNVLFNPTDYDAARETPYFKAMIDKFGDAALALITEYGSVEEQLAKLGLSCTDIDLLVFDHFHTQDLRPLLGSNVPAADGRVLSARFPNAYLLAPAAEWDDWDDLHPMQRAWFIEDGKRGVPTDRVIRFDADLRLGDGCLLLRTPGHTSGNQTIFIHGERGVFGSSENGCSADSWSPYESRIPGLRRFVRRYGVSVILNSNTPESGAAQYNSMMLELSIVDRVPEAPAFVQMFPSSEVTPSALCPGVRPSMLFRERDSGTLQTRDGGRTAVAAE